MVDVCEYMYCVCVCIKIYMVYLGFDVSYSIRHSPGDTSHGTRELTVYRQGCPREIRQYFGYLSKLYDLTVPRFPHLKDAVVETIL